MRGHNVLESDRDGQGYWVYIHKGHQRCLGKSLEIEEMAAMLSQVPGGNSGPLQCTFTTYVEHQKCF